MYKRPSIKISIIAFLAILLSYTSFSAQMTIDDKKSARKIWLEGFEFFERGKTNYKNGQLRKSLTLFNAAMTKFDSITIKYPQWNPALIKFRGKLCNDRIQEIHNVFAQKNIIVTESDADKENLILKTQLNSLRKEVVDTKKQLQRTYISLESARKEAARGIETSNRVEQLMTEKIKLTNKCSLLEDRNKKLNKQVENPTSNVNQTSFDQALLEIETLKKEREKFITFLEKMKLERIFIIKKNNELKLQLKDNQYVSNVNVTDTEAFNIKIKTLKNTIEQLKITTEEQNTELTIATEKLKNTNNAIVKLQKNVQVARSNANLDADAITQQLSNDNELLLKSLETANIKLIEKNRVVSKLEEGQKLSNNNISTLKSSLSNIDKKHAQMISDLAMLNKKVFITDTITRKQDKTIIKQKEQYDTLKVDFDAISKKYSKMQTQKEDFAELAKSLIATEGQNQILTNQNKKLEAGKKELIKSSKLREIELGKAQENFRKSILETAKLEAENLKIKVKMGNAKNYSKNELKELKTKFASTSKLNNDYNKKLEMLTDELILINSNLAIKTTSNEKLTKELAEYKKQATAPVIALPEPEILTQNPQFIALQHENKKLSLSLKQKDKQIAMIKAQKIIPKHIITVQNNVPTASAKEIASMLKSANIAEKNGKNEAAIWYYEKILKKSKEDPTALARLGTILATSGHDDKAIKLLNKALQYNNDDIDLLLALTFCYIRKELYFEALGVASKASAQNPKDPTIQRYLGIICSYLNWNDAADKQFRKSFKLDPTSAETAYNAAVHIAKTDPKRKEEAKIWYKRAIQLGAEKDPMMEKLIK